MERSRQTCHSHYYLKSKIMMVFLDDIFNKELLFDKEDFSKSLGTEATVLSQRYNVCSARTRTCVLSPESPLSTPHTDTHQEKERGGKEGSNTCKIPKPIFKI